jgi:hypothetical protein
VTSVGLYDHTPSPNLADSAFQWVSVGFEKTDTRGGKFWLSALLYFAPPKVLALPETMDGVPAFVRLGCSNPHDG